MMKEPLVETDDGLVKRYEALASARGRALDRGDSTSANRAFDEEIAIREELRRRGPAAMRLLLSLLKSSDPWVRLDSSVPALFFASEEAEPVLELLTNEPKALGISAYMNLKQWRTGKLKPL